MTTRLARGRRPAAASRRLSPIGLVLLVIAALLVPGCGPRKTPLAHTMPSAEALAQAVLDAVEARDLVRLRELALDEREFREHVWPELPAARPGRNLPFDYVWGDLKQKSDASLAQIVERVGPAKLRLVRVEFTGETTQYASFRVHRDSRLVVADGQGREQQIRVFGSMLETADGRVKVFSYVVD